MLIYRLGSCKTAAKISIRNKPTHRVTTYLCKARIFRGKSNNSTPANGLAPCLARSAAASKILLIVHFTSSSNNWWWISMIHFRCRDKDGLAQNCSISKVLGNERPPSSTEPYMFITLKPRQNGRHFADDTFKCIFLNEDIRISFKISLKFVP